MLSPHHITPSAPHILRFYAKCFVYPYDEMNYELQYLYRIIERDISDTEEEEHAAQILYALNQLQGEDINTLRDDYVLMFSTAHQNQPLCPLYASDFLSLFAKHYNAEKLDALFYESALPFSADEPADSIVNLLEYLSLLFEQEDDEQEIDHFLQDYILNWLPNFCDVLFRVTNIDFYREVAGGLKEYTLWL